MRLLVAATLLTGCQLLGSGNLPTYDPGAFCSLAELRPATMHVQPAAEPPTWIESPDGTRTNLEWPEGFRLGVDRGVGVVIEPDGIAVATDDDRLTDVGGGASTRGDDWFAVCVIDGHAYTSREP